MVMPVNAFVGMAVRGLVLSMNMGVGVDMLVRVGMHQVTMLMRVVVDVGMLVDVLQSNCVLYHQHGGNYQNAKANVELHGRPLSKYQHTECHTKERRNGIIGAGFGCTQILLGFNIEVDTQTVCHKTQQKNSGDPENAGNFLTDNQSNKQTSKAGKDTLDGGDLNGGFGTEHTGTVVLQSPAAGCT